MFLLLNKINSFASHLIHDWKIQKKNHSFPHILLLFLSIRLNEWAESEYYWNLWERKLLLIILILLLEKMYVCLNILSIRKEEYVEITEVKSSFRVSWVAYENWANLGQSSFINLHENIENCETKIKQIKYELWKLN